MKEIERWVVKVGSNLVCEGGPLLMREWMGQLAKLRRDHQIEVVWVTSGAIASAVERTNHRKPNRTLSEKQALSAIGQPLLMDLYNLALQSTGLMGAQILLTYDDISNETRRGNLIQSLQQLLEWQVVPLLNENDAIATDEIKFGDNDSLSAKVAIMLKADRLVILTDVNGLYDSNPQNNPKAALVTKVKSVTPKLLETALTKSDKATRGTGGMYSKLMAAKEAATHGIDTFLVKGDVTGVLVSLAEGKKMGTWVKGK